MSAAVDANTPARELLRRSLDGPEGHDGTAVAISALSREQLHTALVELLDLVDEFVHRLAEHNAISERAVLRSMGIEPDRRPPAD